MTLISRRSTVIVFDMDGVLFDSIDLAWRHFLARHPGVTKEMFREVHLGNYHTEIQKLAHRVPPRTEEERKIQSASYTEEKSRTPLFEGMKELLEALHADGIVLTVNTNAFERNCVPLLEYNGIRTLFDFIASAEVSKSKVEKFKIIEDRYAVSNDRLLFITDALGDVRDADEAHVPTIAVTWGVHDESYFAREPHENLRKVVHSVSELKASILSMVA